MTSVNSYLFRAPFGIPGDLSRNAGGSTVETQALNVSLPFPGFGLPGKIVTNKFVPVSASTDVVYGFLVRPFPTQGINASDPLGTAVPFTSGACSVLRRGYLNVKVNAGTAALGGPVYVRYANGTTGTPIGGIEATSVSGSNLPIPNCQFMGPADSNLNGEIFFDNPGQPAAI